MACPAHQYANQRHQTHSDGSMSSSPGSLSNDSSGDYDSDDDEYDDDIYDTEKEDQDNVSCSKSVSIQAQPEEDIEVVFDRLSGDLLSRFGRIGGLGSKPGQQESTVDKPNTVVGGDGRTSMDSDRLRNWKDRSQRENIILQEKNELLVKEMANQKKQSEERYEALMHEKIALAEHLYVSSNMSSAHNLANLLSPFHRVRRSYRWKSCSLSLALSAVTTTSPPWFLSVSCQNGSRKKQERYSTKPSWYTNCQVPHRGK